MKHSRLLLILTLILTNFRVNAQWTELNTGVTETLNAVYFINSDTGFTGGVASLTSATLLKTTDGGQNWSSVTINTVNSIRSIVFSDSNLGFLTTNQGGEGFRTVDGGQTWNVINSAIFNAGDTYFKSLQTGFCYSPGNGDDVSFSIDSGATWTRYPNGTFNGAAVSAIHFPSPTSNIGYAATSWGGDIFKTMDNGNSWTQIAQPTSQDYNDIYFTDENNGFVIGNSFILSTSDGGINWQVISSSFGGKKILYTDNGSSFISYGDTVYKSTDDWNTWISLTGTSSTIRDFQFPDNQTGYAVGSNKVYKIASDTLSIDKENITKFNIKLYPNPTSDIITLKGINSLTDVSYIHLLDNKGALLRKIGINETQVDLSSFSTGIYFIEIKHQLGSGRIKVIKQ